MRPPSRPAPGPSSSTQSARRNDVDIVLDNDDRIAVTYQGLHRGDQALDIAWVQPDRRFVKDVEHPGGVRPHGRGQLDPLPFPGRQRGTGAVELQIGQAEVEQRIEDLGSSLVRPFGHAGDSPGKGAGKRSTNSVQLAEIERTDLGQVASVQLAAQRVGLSRVP